MVSWDKVTITNDTGDSVEATAPVIVSASRSTDIPACYAEWFMNRLQHGHLVWINPFNQQPQYVSFDKTRVIIFWTKNAEPIIPRLPIIDNKGINYYFQYTLNNYEKERLEPNIPSLEKRIASFQQLSRQIGKERVIWRYDPILVSDSLNIPEILSRVEYIGEQISPYTTKLVFSFIDIVKYKKVKNNVTDQSIRELSPTDIELFIQGITTLNKKWGLELATCGEAISLEKNNIQKNRCIDGDLMMKLFSEDLALKDFLRKNNSKDTGQRKECGCIWSKDIGQYNTCTNLCVYCYANRTETLALKNYETHLKNPSSETITGEIPKKIPSKNAEKLKEQIQTHLF